MKRKFKIAENGNTLVKYSCLKLYQHFVGIATFTTYVFFQWTLFFISHVPRVRSSGIQMLISKKQRLSCFRGAFEGSTNRRPVTELFMKARFGSDICVFHCVIYGLSRLTKEISFRTLKSGVGWTSSSSSSPLRRKRSGSRPLAAELTAAQRHSAGVRPPVTVKVVSAWESGASGLDSCHRRCFTRFLPETWGGRRRGCCRSPGCS